MTKDKLTQALYLFRDLWCQNIDISTIDEFVDDYTQQQVKNLNIPAVVNWVAVTDRLPEEKKFRMSADVLTIAGDKMSVKCYDYELMRWTGSPHITVKYWMPLPEPPCL